MFTIIGLMLFGILTGFLLRKYNLSGCGKIITLLIWGLLFLLGIEVGSNKQIIESIATLGIKAFILTIAAVLGSCFTAYILWYLLYKRKGNRI